MSKKVLAGRYELLERRGNGGMAVVYKGKDCLLNRYVAIKILRPEYIKDPKFVDNFRRESQAAARLTDPNIVSVYDVGREGNIYYIVMELMDGSSLGDVIQNEAPLSEKRTIEITRQIASGLSSAHKKKIIHRDIKPHNILMSENGDAKIADFGIAKAVSGATVVNSSTTVMGSVHYLSPEQARGGFVDARTDIYSLGIVMFEMLTGIVPFDGENAVSVAMMHINNDVPAPSRFNNEVSWAMDNIVKKAAARNPADRYESADELIEALDNAARGVPEPPAGAARAFGKGDFYTVNPAEEKRRDINGREEIIPAGAVSSVPPEISQPRKSVKPRDNETASKKARMRKKKKKNPARRAKILGVILALVCAIPLSILLLHAIGSLGDDTVAIPNVLGMTEQQAAEKLQDKGLEYELGTSVFSEKYDEGEVCAIDPEAGTHVKKGYTVTLRLARESSSKAADDSEKIKVPDVRKQTLSKARTLITDEGLKVGEVTYDYSDTIEEGSVISQDPGAGEKVKSGSKVNLTVSRGEEQKDVKVPDLMGMTRAEASAALEKLGLSLGDVTQEYSSSEIGTVVRQGVAAGTSVQPGSKVNISISKGSSSSSQNTDTDNSNSGKKTDSGDNNSDNSGSSSGNSGNSSGNSGNSSSNSGNSSGNSGGNSGGSGGSSGGSGGSSGGSGGSSGGSGGGSGSSGGSSGGNGGGSSGSGGSSGGGGNSSGSNNSNPNDNPPEGVHND